MPARTADRLSVPSQVSVRIWGNMAMIAPPPTSFLNELEYSRVSFQPEGHLGHSWRKTTVQHYEIEDGQLWVPAGLVPRLVQGVGRQGGQVEVVDHRRSSQRCRTIDQRVADEALPHERAMLHAVCEHYLGQAVVRGEEEFTRSVALIRRYVPDAVILVVAATERRVREIYRGLLRHFPGVILQQGYCWPTGFTCVVCTMKSLETYSDVVDIIIVANPTDLLAKDARSLCWLPQAKIISISIAHENLRPWEQLHIEALCGPEIYRQPNPAGELAEVIVQMCSGPLTPSTASSDALSGKRQTSWNNRPRNQWIADLAEAISHNCATALAAASVYGVLDTLPTVAGDRRVTVLVESVEHGEMLREMLPEWPLLRRGAQSQCAAQGNWLPRQSIMTLSFAAEIKSLYTDVIIVASGGEGLTELPGYPPRCVFGQQRQMLVIDLVDDQDEDALATTQARMDRYRSRSWYVSAPRRLLRV